MENVFNTDPSKDSKKVLFLRKKQFQIHLTISLNNIQVQRASYQQHLDIILDENLNFKQHIHCVISQVKKGIFVIGKNGHRLVPKYTIYEDYLRPFTDGGDIIYNQPENKSHL